MSFEAGIRSLANTGGRLWVEKVKVSTTRPVDLAAAREDDADRRSGPAHRQN
jgi:hypothetical protein